MRPRSVVGMRETAEIFSRAVHERALAVVTLQDAADWYAFKSRFLERDPRGRFVILDYQPTAAEQPATIGPGQLVGVSFRQRGRKLLFATVVEARGHFVLDHNQQVPALRYRWPESMTELQRRAYFRTPLPPDLPLFVSIWSGGLAAAALHEPVQMFSASVVDLSCGGAMVRLHEARALPWNDGQTIGVELQLPDKAPPARLDARYRGVRGHDTQDALVALQFIGLELSSEGRTVLQRLAGAVQRIHRLSVESLH